LLGRGVRKGLPLTVPRLKADRCDSARGAVAMGSSASRKGLWGCRDGLAVLKRIYVRCPDRKNPLGINGRHSEGVEIAIERMWVPGSHKP
jgi:hypothetical protein